MSGNDFMALKIPNPERNDSVLRTALQKCGLDTQITEQTTRDNHICLTLNNGAKINHYFNGTVQIQGPAGAKREVEEALENNMSTFNISEAQPVQAHTPKKIFIVHGHDHTAKDQLELILHKLGLPDHFILQNTGGTGLTIIEELEREIGQGQTATRFGIVLLTPDDVGYAKRDTETAAQPRARQNVVLEMGMLLSSLGRSNVVILQKQHLEKPSDASGIIYLNFNEHVKETVPRLVQRLEQAGFTFNPAQVTSASA